jgi:hypothetical protein
MRIVAIGFTRRVGLVSSVDERDRTPPVAAGPSHGEASASGQRPIGSLELLAVLLVLLVIFHKPFAAPVSDARPQTWTTVFVSVLVHVAARRAGDQPHRVDRDRDRFPEQPRRDGPPVRVMTR